MDLPRHYVVECGRSFVDDQRFWTLNRVTIFCLLCEVFDNVYFRGTLCVCANFNSSAYYCEAPYWMSSDPGGGARMSQSY